MELVPLKGKYGRNDPRVQVYSGFFLSYPGAPQSSDFQEIHPQI